MFKRRTKQITATLIAFVLTVSLSGEAFAAGEPPYVTQTTQTTPTTAHAKTTPTYNKASSKKVMVALKVIPKKKTTKAGFKKKVTRQEFAKMLVKLSPYKDQVSSTTKTSMYSDVKTKSSYAPYIKIAVQNGWMKGNLMGKFRPTAAITLQEAVNGVVAVLGYADSDFVGNRSSAKIAFYKNNKLNKNISRGRTAKLTYADVTYLLYNLLVTPTKSGSIYGETLGYTLDSNGDVDYLSIIYDEMDGPIVATGDWKKELPFSLSSATVYVDGEKSSASDINEYDVLYYSKKQKHIFVYKDRVTGRLNGVSPDRYTPNKVTVAGTDYVLANQDISYAVSVLGSYEIGDYITLLLGRDEKVVGIGNAATLNSFIGGIVINTEEKVSDDKDSTDVKKYITMLDTTGETHEYEVEDLKGYENKTPVEVNYENGKPTVNKVSLQRLNGTVDRSASTFAGYDLGDDIRILEYDPNGSFAKIDRKRLAGLTINASKILYYHINSDHELTDLMVRGVTGDNYSYGILVSATEIASPMTMTFQGTYGYQIGDKTGVAQSNGMIFGMQGYSGPAQFSFGADGSVKSIKSLGMITVTSITQTEVSDGSRAYAIDDNVGVYLKKGSNFYVTELTKVKSLNNYELRAYHDGLTGGRVRVIVAEAK